MQESAFNLALLASPTFFLGTSSSASSAVASPSSPMRRSPSRNMRRSPSPVRSNTSIAALAEQVKRSNETLVAQSGWSLSANCATWLPQNYAMVPVPPLGFLIYQCDPCSCCEILQRKDMITNKNTHTHFISATPVPAALSILLSAAVKALLCHTRQVDNLCVSVQPGERRRGEQHGARKRAFGHSSAGGRQTAPWSPP